MNLTAGLRSIAEVVSKIRTYIGPHRTIRHLVSCKILLHVNSKRILVFALALTLIVGPVMPVFAAHSEDTTCDSRHPSVDAHNVCDHTSSKQNICLEHNASYGQCCAHCFAVSVVNLSASGHSSAVPGYTVPLLKPSLAVVLHTKPPKALV